MYGWGEWGGREAVVLQGLGERGGIGGRGEQEEEQGEMVEVSALGTDRGGCATADWLLIERDG